MIIHVDRKNPAQLTLEDGHNFGTLALKVSGDVTDRIEVLAVVGRWVDNENVYVDPKRIRALAPAAADTNEWSAGFDNMLAYAAKGGWVDDRGHVRMHVKE